MLVLQKTVVHFKIKNKYNYVGLFLILTLLSLFFYWHTISLPPSFIHAWTQSDRYAISLKFLENGFDIFHPQTFNLSTIDGITSVDLPIHEFIVAILMKLFGTTNPTIFRLYVLLISFIGYFYLYKLSFKILKSSFWSYFVVIFTFTLPIITYYQSSFLPSSTSFSLCIIGYYYYHKYKETIKNNNLWKAIFFITLAALSRSPFNIFLFAILCKEVLLSLKHNSINPKKYLPFLIGYTCIISYQLYKNYITQKYGTQFLTTIKPATTLTDSTEITIDVFKRWKLQLFTYGHYAVFILLVISSFFKKNISKDFVKKSLFIDVGILIAGFVIYYLLMANQFIAHEYYFIDSFYIIAVLAIMALCCNPYLLHLSNMIFKIAAIIFIGAFIYQSQKLQKEKYSFQFWDTAEMSRKNYEKATLLLDSIGIPKNAKLLLPYATTTSYALMQLGRNGYTVIDGTYEKIKKAMNLNYDYIVTEDRLLASETVYHYPNFLNEVTRIGGNGKISIFKKEGTDSLDIAKAIGSNNIYSLRQHFDSVIDTQNWDKIKNYASDFHSPPLCAVIDNNDEFGPTVQLIRDKKVNKLLFEGYFKTEYLFEPIKIVVTLYSKEQQTYYWEYDMQPNILNEWCRYQCLFFLPKAINNNELMKVFIWNPNQQRILVDDISITFLI
jgi:hypothetical protein